MDRADKNEVFRKISEALLVDYSSVYYVNAVTNEYYWYSTDPKFHSLRLAQSGDDFFENLKRDCKKVIYEEDQYIFLNDMKKENLLGAMAKGSMQSVEYRLLIDGIPTWHALKLIRGIDPESDYFILGVINIDEEVKATRELTETRKKSITYSQIAESLAAQYDLIYYVDINTTHYIEFASHKIYGKLEIQEEGDDFFVLSNVNADKLIYTEDRERIKLFLDKDNLISKLENNRHLVEDYRMVVDGSEPRYTRMTVSWSSDKTHLIICIEDREEFVKKEQEHIRALSLANEIARQDSLTGTRNKTAYQEYESNLQHEISGGSAVPFGIIVCDLNDLKIINDTKGHKAGDEYIKSASRLICHLFSHSPVFRVGGDEFVIILKDEDYISRNDLFAIFKRQVEDNVKMGRWPVIASGFAKYRPDSDTSVDEIFKRADGRMYEDKAYLKELKLLRESRSAKNRSSVKSISEDRRKLLDSLFQSYFVVAGGTYVYLCDMKYDFSRWSKAAVDAYALPSEYMYGAGEIWEEVIHPEDRERYHKGIEEIFSGNASGHDMQYRVRRPDGQYEVCTCSGNVIRDLTGEPDYFVGTLRIHGTQGHIDTLTALRNQYGFFEDLDSCIKRKAVANVIMIGISKFSEINEVYGYHYGNRVLQSFARKILDAVSNTGTCYRIDGTKFAIINYLGSANDLEERYLDFRNYFREVFRVDNKRIMLEVNCGALKLDRFELDSQTVYAGLNYAYGESKAHRHGDLVMFNNDLNEDNKQRLEKLHAIRASIKHGYEGFYLMYQPVVDAIAEKMTGAEALIRWKNDDYGLVPPDQFVPLLESDPLFPELGEWIIREALTAAKKILEKIPDFVININLSYTQLERADFVDVVFGILDEMEYPAGHLCFEITERCRLLDIELLKNVVVRLKSKGIMIALDDFGTGFSSVGIVRELPFDIIKIDRGFVQRIEVDAVDRELVKYISGLASIFGAKVCVEGIETEGMRDILQDFHVESFQGYYYAKPLLADDVITWRPPVK